MSEDLIVSEPSRLFLDYTDYFSLLKMRDEVNKEVNALGTIVLTANMNVEVLMQNVLEKKKRAIARIDASQTGQLFLSSMLNEAPTNEIEAIVKRLTVGSRVGKLRENTNLLLQKYDTHLSQLTLPATTRKVLAWKFVDNEKTKLKSQTLLGFEVKKNADELDSFVCEVILEELIWLQAKIKSE